MLRASQARILPAASSIEASLAENVIWFDMRLLAFLSRAKTDGLHPQRRRAGLPESGLARSLREETRSQIMLADLYEGLNLHVHGLPKFMRHMDPDKMSASQRNTIVSIMSDKMINLLLFRLRSFLKLQLGIDHSQKARARKACLETEKNGAHCIF